MISLGQAILVAEGSAASRLDPSAPARNSFAFDVDLVFLLISFHLIILALEGENLILKTI